ncbi:MAG: hypothetical protein JRE28_15330 [Deltaproteobacteria bacterium]|nr:hypothetical protein [Deltaproteobacteria bacterium]
MTYKERMMAAIKGEMPDVIPYAPRLDLWYAAHSAADTLPVKYKNSSVDEICRAEGWGLYKVTADYKYIQDSAPERFLSRKCSWPPKPWRQVFLFSKINS